VLQKYCTVDLNFFDLRSFDLATIVPTLVEIPNILVIVGNFLETLLL